MWQAYNQKRPYVFWENAMPKIGLLIIAVAVAGCASTRQERAEAFQQELPQLIAACNEAFSGADSLTRDGINACERIAAKKGLRLTDPATASAYVRYANARSESRRGLEMGL